MKPSPWLVVGSGAIGLFWACKLKSLGHKVHLVYRSTDPGKKITLDSLVDESGQQQAETQTYKIKTFTASTLEKQYQKVLLCTKSFDLVEAYQQVSEHLSDEADIVCLCNGLGAQDQLQKQIQPEQTLWAGVTSEGVLKIEPNHIKHTGLGDTYFGPWLPSGAEKAFPLEGFEVRNIHQRILEKLAVNAVINPITAIFNLHNGDILNDEFQTLMQATLTELERVFTHPKFAYAKHSQHLSYDNLKNRVSTVAKLTRLNRSSMFEDMRLQRQTENDFISGFLMKNSPVKLTVQALLYEGINQPDSRPEVQKKLLSLT